MQRIATLSALLPLVAAHGFIRSPTPRQPGEGFKAACGEQPFYQQSSDINGNVQGIFQVVGQDKKLDPATCNLWLCKGFQFDDNKSNVQSYTLGQNIDFDINIAAPHTGYANVSVVKTSSNSIIGSPLIEFNNYASNSGMDKNNTAFSVTLPKNLGGECTKAGECVLQWFWDAPDINQTYESCVDFTVAGGSGSAPAPGGSASSSAAPVATSAAAATPSAPASTPTQTPGGEDAGEDEECPADEEGTDVSNKDVSSTPAASTPAASAPAATPTAPAGTDDEEECPAEEEGSQGTDDGEECPADEEDDQGSDEECPAEGDDDATPAAPTSVAAAAAAAPSSKSDSPKSDSPKSDSPSAVTSYITVSAAPTTVTVTAQAPACTA